MKTLTPPASLHGPHLRTYEAIFRHPAAHNLAWREVHALLRRLAQVSEEPNGNLKVLRHGHTLVLRPSRTKDVSEVFELMELRQFLERSEEAAAGKDGVEPHWLVVIDHHQARLFRTEMADATAQHILPHEPDDYFRHAPHSKDFSRGMEKPEPNSFFRPVAKALSGAHPPTGGGKILVFGNGKGMASEMEQFIAWLKVHHPELAGRIVGSLVIDEHHLTEPQLCARAREFYANFAALTITPREVLKSPAPAIQPD